MCGIAGVLGREDKELVRRMCDRLEHRGPDGADMFQDQNVTLGHRRLAIIDVEGGRQPMVSHDGRFTVVFNGEIYNHARLRQELEDAEAKFVSDHSDTEVLLEGYRKWGEGLFGRLEGMFAFALWDSQQKELIVARDPFGIKPLFYACTGGEFIFASEAKALFAHPNVSFRPDKNRIKERTALEFLQGQNTLFEGIHQLPPGSFAVVKPTKIPDCHLAWQPHYLVKSEEFATIEAAAFAIKERLVESVKEQMMSDVPIGVVLSGGLDSAVVAQIQASASDVPIQTFTVADNEEVDDFRWSKELASQLGSQHHEAFFDLDEMLHDLPRYTWHNENINYTEFFFLPLFAMVQRHAKVALCGQGADELWGGYERYRDPMPLAKQRIERIRLANPNHAEELATQVALTHASGSALAEYDQMGGQLHNFQLRLVDRNSMAHSVEARVPFLSRPLHSASRAIGWNLKLHEGVEKWILRHALSDLGLAKEFVWRPKIPAGRATSPRVMEQFDHYADGMISKQNMSKHPLAGSFRTASEQLVHDVWHETFLADGKISDVSLEQFA